MTRGLSISKSFARGVLVKFITFAGVGVIGTCTHYLALIISVQGFGIAPVIASALGFSIGALINYLLNYKFTFRSNKRHTETVVKFYSVALAGLIINTLIMALAIAILPLHYIFSQFKQTKGGFP